MARRRAEKKKKNFFARAAVSGLLACVLAAGIGFFVATRGLADATALEDAAGAGPSAAFRTSISVVALPSEQVEAETPATTAQAPSSGVDVFQTQLAERSQLATLTRCDLSAGLQAMSDRLEEERRIAEEAARLAELEHISLANAKKAGYSNPGSLSDINWDQGKAAFIEEWGSRINSYLAGSNLAGYGETFAEAAWEYSVDPRWSPAISNTDSGKGSHCFLPCKAWGWGSTSWSNWTDAIWAHVAGLSAGYGYGITMGGAQKYCPPNYTNWYNNTLSEMSHM